MTMIIEAATQLVQERILRTDKLLRPQDCTWWRSNRLTIKENLGITSKSEQIYKGNMSFGMEVISEGITLIDCWNLFIEMLKPQQLHYLQLHSLTHSLKFLSKNWFWTDPHAVVQAPNKDLSILHEKNFAWFLTLQALKLLASSVKSLFHGQMEIYWKQESRVSQDVFQTTPMVYERANEPQPDQWDWSLFPHQVF